MSYNNNKRTALAIHDGILYALSLKIEKAGPVIKNYATIELEEGVMDEDCIILDKEAFKASVRQLLSKGVHGKFSAKKIILSLPEEKVFSHLISLPKDKINDLRYIKTLANESIPIEMDAAVFDAQVIDSNESSNLAHLECVAVQASIVQPLLDALHEMKMEVSAIDIDTNALARVYDNTFSKIDDQFVLIHLGQRQDTINLVSSKGRIYKHLLRHEPLVERSSDVYVNDLKQKIVQLLGQVGGSEDIQLKQIHVIGKPEDSDKLKSVLPNLYPDVQIEEGLRYMSLPEGMESEFLQAIGLCLRGFEGGIANHFNLLTEERKSELSEVKVASKGKWYLFLIISFLAAFLVWLGIRTAGTYFDYQFSHREIAMLNEQINDPYVAELAQIKKQQQEKDSQMATIFNEILPMSPLFWMLDGYNREPGIDLVSLSYSDKDSEGLILVYLTATAHSRLETEAFVEKLKSQDIFVEVDSPLSNLVSKGERLISITLKLEPEIIKQLTLGSEVRSLEVLERVSASEEDDVPDEESISEDVNESNKPSVPRVPNSSTPPL